MKQIKRQLGYSTAAAVIMFGLATIPVSAETGSGTNSGSGDTTSSVSKVSSQSGTDSRHVSGVATTDSNLTAATAGGDSSQQSGNLRSEAATLLNQDRKNSKEHTAAQRLKACEERQTDINKHSTQFATEAAKHLDTFNSIFTKLQAFQVSKHLTVSNYSTLLADATAKQATAQTAVTTLKTLDVNINCSQPDPASTVATIKESVSSTRTALQAYRTSLKNLVVAMKGASTAQSTTTTNTQATGGAQ